MPKKDTVNVSPRKLQASGLLNNRAVLVILSENLLGHAYVLNKSVNIIGRRDDCDIVVNDPLISNRHCRIIYNENDHFEIEDLDSTNKTYLNNKILKKPAILTYGDRIVIGDTIFRFFHEEKFETK